MRCLLLTVLLSCRSAPEPAAEPADVLNRIEAIADPIERIATIEQILRDDPAQALVLCPQIPAGAARLRCDEIAKRPHLWTERPRSEQGRTAPGPASARPQPARWPPALESTGCVEECAFRAAEDHVREQGGEGYSVAVGLCVLAGDFRADCLAHLYPGLIGELPAATAPAEAWAPITATAEGLGAFWEPIDAAFAVVAVDRFWSEVTARATDAEPWAHGALLRVLPAAAAPHVRAAVALQWLSRQDPPDLPTAQARLAAVLERRPATTVPRPRRPRPASDLWPSDSNEGEDGAISAVAYLGQSRRAVSEDPGTDQLLALLEAAARVQPPRRDLLQAATLHSDAVVRWTAHRLLAP